MRIIVIVRIHDIRDTSGAIRIMSYEVSRGSEQRRHDFGLGVRVRVRVGWVASHPRIQIIPIAPILLLQQQHPL